MLIYFERWTSRGLLFLRWTQDSKSFLYRCYLDLFLHTKKYLSRNCTHIKGMGGLKRGILKLNKNFNSPGFFARFDIKHYYRSIDHRVLFQLLKVRKTPTRLIHILQCYVRTCGCKGIPAGGSISPLLGAIYLDPLDQVMDRLCKKNKIIYIRYMDDYVILSSTRWQLRKAILQMYRVLDQLNLSIHPDKKDIGRVKKGIDFLGYHLSPRKKLTASPIALSRFSDNFRRLYEQGVSIQRLWQYTEKWTSWLWGGLGDSVSIKGGVRRYFYYALKQNGIEGIRHPYSRSGFT